MRKLLIVIWLLLPVFAGAYHYGPGQDKLMLDKASQHIRSAETFVAAEQWAQAVSSYESALELLPAKYTSDSRRIRLERDKAWMYDKKLPQAHADLLQLVEEMSEENAPDQQLLAEARETLANARYYLTWLMRLEGQPRDVWEPEIEASRQTYRMLAENAYQADDPERLTRYKEDLESAIRLARMDLADLQGLPLPSQCNCKGSKAGKGGSGKKSGQPKQRAEDARGASSGPPPDGKGS